MKCAPLKVEQESWKDKRIAQASHPPIFVLKRALLAGGLFAWKSAGRQSFAPHEYSCRATIARRFSF